MQTKTQLRAMGAKIFLLLHFQDIFSCISRRSAGRRLRYFLLLHYFRNCEINISISIYIFWTLQRILTGLLLLPSYMRLRPGKIYHDVLLVRQSQIKIYLIPSWFYMQCLPSHTRLPIYQRFKSQCLRIEHKYYDTLKVPRWAVLSDHLVVIFSDVMYFWFAP